MLCTQNLPLYVYNNFFSTEQKDYYGILDVSYQIYGAYIIMLFTQNLSKVCFQKKYSRLKIIVVFVCKLSSPLCIYYQLFTEKITRVIFFSKIF